MRASDLSGRVRERRVLEKPGAMRAIITHRLLVNLAAAVCLVVSATSEAYGRDLISQVTEPDQISRVHPEYPVPNEPNMLFYIERSVNSNTVVYAANLDGHGNINSDEPIIAYWRWYNVDGHRKPLNLVERLLAYGVTSVTHNGPGAFSFKIAGLPERTIFVDLDSTGRPEAFGKVGTRSVKLIYIYLEVDDSGLWPDVTAMDFFGIDKASGQPVREHVTRR
jgi:hypothetical protein